MKNGKKLGAFLLVLSMLLGILPFGVGATEQTQSAAQIKYQQLTLNDALTMRFDIAVDSAYADTATVTVKVGENVLLNGQKYNTFAAGVADCRQVLVNLAAAQMNDTIQISVSNDGLLLTEGTYSIRNYASYLLEGKYDAYTKQLVRYMLHYGATAQSYFEYNTENLANAGYEAISLQAVPTQDLTVEKSGSVPGITFYGASLEHESRIAVNFYFSAPDGVEGLTFSANGNSYEAENRNGLYSVMVTDINPQEYDKPVVMTVSDGSNEYQVSYSPMHYIVRMSKRDTSSDSLKELLKALYNYHLAAKSYMGLNVQIESLPIIANTVEGTWVLDRVGDSKIGPEKTYDGDESSVWNPRATNYKSGEAIVYTLDKVYSLDQVQMLFSLRHHYFTISTSLDGVNYTPVAEVTEENADTHFAGLICTVDGLTDVNAKYVKISFTGAAAGTTFISLNEIGFYGQEAMLEDDGREASNGTIIAHQILGTWAADREGSGSIGPHLSYDGDSSSLWNPQATSYKHGEGIIYTLDKNYDVTQIELSFKNREYYFELYVSSDGVNYLPVSVVTPDNSADYYTSQLATLSNLTNTNVKYIKIMFTGNAGAFNAYIGLNEITVTCKEATLPEDNREVVAAPIIGHEIVGTWENDYGTSDSLGPKKSYDGDAEESYWQGKVINYTSGAGIVYKLDDTYDLKTITVTQKQRPYYFDLYVSTDGESYTPLMKITKDNYAEYYAGNTAVLDNLTCTGVQYIQLIFTGNTTNSIWTGVSEVAVTGVKVAVIETVDVGVSGAFSSNMVLQRNQPIPVWGWGTAGDVITGVFAGETVTATADETGYWKLIFPAQSANAAGQTMTITSTTGQCTVFENVLIGDVYIINGQSNAELAVNRTAAHFDNNGKEEVKNLFRQDENIRIFHQIKAGVVERTDLWAEPQANVINEEWQWAVAAQNDAFWTFSALGMYFAKNLRDSLSEDVPIGLIQTAAGGAFLDEIMPNELNQQFGYTGSHTVTTGGYYNTMMNPFVGYPIAGMLFFQGESNNYMTAETYARDLAAYITELRTRWGIDFNFYNVQLSSYGQYQVDNNIWPYLSVVRNEQYQLLNSLDNYYLTVSMDRGYAGEVDMGTNVQDYMHPKDKKTLGERVAKQAMAVYYGELEVGENTFSPVPSDIQWNADGILISFDNADTLALATGDALVGFQCVINEEVVDVAAQIVNGNQVLLPVDATTVSEIRYAMFSLAYQESANLINGGNLPAPGFAIANPGEFTTTKVVIKKSEPSVNGWKSIGVGAALPWHTYDGDMETYWNPQVLAFADKPSVTYYLNVPADISGMVLTFMKRQEYFTLYASTGDEFVEVANITADNYTDYVCTVSGLDLKDVTAIKLEFTGSSDGTLWIGLYEIELDAVPAGTEQEPEEPEVTEPPVEVDAVVIGHQIIGNWTNSGATSASLGPHKSYDGVLTNSYWQGQVPNYTSGCGIIYQLDSAYDLTKLVLTQQQRPYYFNISVSTDGVTFVPLAEITKDNYTQYYDGNTCTIDGLTAENVVYIQIIFTGNTTNSLWTSLAEIEVTGVKVTITENIKAVVSGVFSSNMVLQRNQPIPVWGWGTAGETVTGNFAGTTATAVVDESGYWKLTFPAQSANAVGQTMTITTASNQIAVFENILIGDVYIVNGQSNAELSLQRTAAHLDVAEKETVKELFRYDSNIRLYNQQKAYVVEHTDLWAEPQADVINEEWQWTVAAENDNFWLFSALGMYFAKNVRESLSQDIPIGLIQTAAGGAYLDELMPNELNAQFGYTSSHTVSVGGYYNTMIHPFVGYPIAGMLYFQGESNNYSMAANYARDLAAYVTELRTRWGMDFNFYNVQLSSYGQQQVDNNFSPYLHLVRNEQYQMIGSLDNYYLTVSMDVGYRGEIDQGTNVEDWPHPKDKKTLGERIAKQALAVYYKEMPVGEKNFSPVPSDIQWNTDGILISFENADTLALATGDTLVGFQCVINEEVVDVAAQIVNGNQVFLPVDATTVSEIRYGIFFLCYPENANLVNGGELPAPAFAIKNPGTFTTNKVVIKTSETSVDGWKSIGIGVVPPELSYDGDMETYWNPQVGNYADGPSITYYLNIPGDISSLTFHFMNRQVYFTLYASTGDEFVEVANITADNYTDYVCTVSDLNLTDIISIKLVFTGTSGNSLWIGLYEIELNAVPAGTQQEPEEPEVTEPPVEVDAVVIGHQVIGTWTNDYGSSASLGPQNSYDGDEEGTRYWQGQVPNYNSGCGIIYQLDSAYDLTKLVLIQKSRPYYFNISVSTNGVDFVPLAEITKDNYTQYYDGNTCTIEGLDAAGVVYIQVIFTGNTANSMWTGLNEITITGYKN